MRRPPINGQRDENEAEIVDYLRRFGASVALLSQKDVPDLLVGYKGRTFLIEIKMPGKKLRDGQSEWHEAWRGQVATCTTFEECLEVLVPELR